MDYRISQVVVQPDGKILLAGLVEKFQPKGATSVQSNKGVTIMRLNPDGSLDAGFAAPIPEMHVLSLALQADGKILFGGYFSLLRTKDGATVKRASIARLNADGGLDMAFDPKPLSRPDPENWVWIKAIAVQEDGKILIGGDFLALQPNGAANPTDRRFIARLNTDGSLDAGFDPKPDKTVDGIQVQADGKILLRGQFATLQPNGASTVIPCAGIARLNSDGSVDTSPGSVPDIEQ